MGKKKQKKTQKILEKLGLTSTKTKAMCCEKYKKAEDKRCRKCPCFDLLKKVA